MFGYDRWFASIDQNLLRIQVRLIILVFLTVTDIGLLLHTDTDFNIPYHTDYQKKDCEDSGYIYSNPISKTNITIHKIMQSVLEAPNVI